MVFGAEVMKNGRFQKPGPSLVIQLIEVGILRNSFTEQNGDSVKGRVITQELD